MTAFQGAGLRQGLLATAAAIAAFAGASPAMAQTRNFNVAEQPAARGIPAFARQAGIQLLASGNAVRGRRTNAVRGSMTVQEGLRRLLAGTGLEASPDNGGTGIITIRAAAGASTTGETQAGGAAADDAGADADTLDVAEILVIGNRFTLNADVRRSEDDPQPYVVLTREALERSGATTVEEAIKQDLPITSYPQSNSQVPDSRGNSTRIALRGLDADETLILIDGRRVGGISAAGTPQQPDLSAIPLASIDRIEILPATASGIYGGGATGGVVNVILRRDYAGATARIRFGDTFDGRAPSWNFDVNAGFPLDRHTRVTVAGSYSERDPLLVEERDFVQFGRQQILANNPAQFFTNATPPLGATANVRSVNGANLVLRPQFGGQALSSYFTSVPVGYQGPASDNGAALVANAGRYNLDLAPTAQPGGGGRQSLLNAPRTRSANVGLRRDLGRRVQIFGEVNVSESRGQFFNNAASTTFLLAANAQGNPFTQQVRVTVPGIGADQTINTRIDNLRLLGGIVVQLFDDWRVEADYGWTRNRFSTSSAAPLLNSAATAVSNGVINVFADTPQLNFGPFLQTRPTTPPSESALADAALRAGGSLPLRLPGGRISLTTLLEHRVDEFGEYVTFTQNAATGAAAQLIIAPRRQRVASAYGELRLPLVASGNNVPLVRSLEIQLALRHDDYRTRVAAPYSPPATPPAYVVNDLASTDPTVAIRYEPVRGIVLRGSYGTGFQPPSPSELIPFAPANLPAAALTSFRDPRRGNSALGDIQLLVGGSPDLRPERSTSWSAGVVLTPAFIPNLRLSADWVAIRKRDNIAGLGLSQDNINLELLIPGLVVRAPLEAGSPFEVGRIIAFSSQSRNNAGQKIESIDFSARYAFSLLGGELSLDARATWMIDNAIKATIVAPPIENAGTALYPSWRTSGRVAWSGSNLMVGIGAHHVASHYLLASRAVVANQGSAKVESDLVFDLFGRYDLRGAFDGFSISAGIENLFDARPPVRLSETNTALYSFWSDPQRRRFYVALSRRF